MEYRIVENTCVAPGVYRIRLSGDTSMLTAPGQFCQVGIPGFYLRRPISLCDWDENGMTLIYKAVGQGTEALSRMETGDTLDILNGLGNGYDLSACGAHPLVIGGGVGIPPLFGLTKALLSRGVTPTVILGFNKKEEIFLLEDFRSLGLEPTVTTVDGSFGVRGFVTDALPAAYDSFFACGPLPMLKTVFRACDTPGQLSLEERMACGFGACMGCTIQTNGGAKRVCKDGPVFRKEDLPW